MHAQCSVIRTHKLNEKDIIKKKRWAMANGDDDNDDDGDGDGNENNNN